MFILFHVKRVAGCFLVLQDLVASVTYRSGIPSAARAARTPGAVEPPLSSGKHPAVSRSGVELCVPSRCSCCSNQCSTGFALSPPLFKLKHERQRVFTLLGIPSACGAPPAGQSLPLPACEVDEVSVGQVLAVV